MRARLHDCRRVLPQEQPLRPTWVPAPAWRRLDPLARHACLAVDQLDHTPLQPDDALVLGTAFGSVTMTRRFVDSLATHGDAGGSPSPFSASVHNATAGALAQFLGLQGPCTTISQGGCSGLAALRWALLQIRHGRRVLVVVGDLLDAWSSAVVDHLAGADRPIGSGVAAALLEPGPGGIEFFWGEHPAPRALHCSHGPAARNRARAQAATHGQELCDDLPDWWPTATLCALPDLLPGPVQLRESEGGAQLAAWVGPGSPPA